MCGFFTIVFNKENKNMGSILKNAGERLSYRGYDSTGIAVFNENEKFVIKKDKGSVEIVDKKLNFSQYSGYKGIIQLRWATYGKPSKINAQPHKDCTGRYVSAHNGNIINVHSLFEKLKKAGHRIKSENDGEVIVHIIEDYLNKGKSLNDAVKLAYRDIKGDYAFCFADKKSRKMIAMKKGSSLFAGKGNGFIVVSSDLYAVLDHTNKIIPLKDSEMIEFDSDNYTIRNIISMESIKRSPEKNSLNPCIMYKRPYDSFMEKEISEVPTKIDLLREYYVSSNHLNKLKRTLSKGKLVITGSGTSYNAALLGTYFLNRISGIDVAVHLPSDINDRLKYVGDKSSNLLVVSQSGETKDVKNAIDSFRNYSKGKVIGMINNLASTMGMTSDYILPTISDMEISVPATKTFINQVVLFYILSLFLKGESKSNIDKKIKSLIKSLKKAKKDTDEQLSSLADKLIKRDFMHILGYSLTYPCAKEGALKMKEVNYMNIEAMHSSEFKHGPLALIKRKYPIILITTAKDKHYTLSHINEIQTRSGIIISISQKDKDIEKNSDINITINEKDENCFAIISVYLMQILSLKIAYKKGINPDQPRNISKTITVD